MFEVIIVDDSALIRRILSDIINKIDGYIVVATAVDAYDARDKIKKYEPDLITLDINMPKMDGVNFLKNLIRLHPMPTIVISSNTAVQEQVFDVGAIGFISKQNNEENIDDFTQRIKDTLTPLNSVFKNYSKIKPKKQTIQASTLSVEKKYHPDELLLASTISKNALKVIAIGSSTGGVEALIHIFKDLSANLPPIVITQHIPYGFSTSFANRLNLESKVTVIEATGGEVLQDSYAYLAPGNMHMIFVQKDNQYIIELVDGVKISRHKPSVDIMFRSVSNEFGSKAMGVILTGMGDDGSIGMRELRDNGGYTIAQSEKSCVVYGMPKKADESGGIIKNGVDLDDIAQEIIDFSTFKS